MIARRQPLRRPNMRRAVILFPSGLTLGNLFFGIFAIIAASRGQFVQAGVFVLLGGACDALDGQVARATNAGTQFGEELDSLVDAITFGLAPGLIMYFAVLNRDNWDWLAVFLFSACAVMRLARFNIEQAGTAKTYFQGLPSPAAGITLASYYWFSQSWLYNYGAIADLPWHVLLRYLMAALAFLMISNIPYPVFPRTGFRSLRAIAATLGLIGSIALLATKRLEFFFPFALCYVAWGPIRWIFSGMFERRQPTIPYDLSEGEDDDEEEEPFGPIDSQVHASRQSEREIRPPRAERERARRERPERTERTERTERPERSTRAERPARGERTAPDRTERPARTEATTAVARSEREPRTDAEREARRERREKRDKREKRRERQAGAAATTSAVPVEPAPESGVGAITLGAPVEDAGAPVLSVVRGEGDGTTVGESPERTTAEGAPARKRKRRRRRGQRDRTAGAVGEGTETDLSDAGDAGDDPDIGDNGDHFEAEIGAEPSRPRSPAPSEMPAPVASPPAPPSPPPTVPPPQFSSPVEPAPAPPSSSEPNE
jgi:CDP-diacylglycerol---serine O-phosphatidyltransferase